jgi:hypothetical protein
LAMVREFVRASQATSKNTKKIVNSKRKSTQQYLLAL